MKWSDQLLMMFQSNWIPYMILLQLVYGPGEPACFVGQCWIRNFITPYWLFYQQHHHIYNPQTPRKHSLKDVLSYANDIFNEFSNAHIPVKHGMTKPCCIINNTICMHSHSLWHSLIRIVTSWTDVNSLTFFHAPPVTVSSKFPNKWFMFWFNLQITVLVSYFPVLVSWAW